MPEVFYQIKRLEKLADKCGVAQKKEERPDVDTSKMSPYEKQQYSTALVLQRLRQNILDLDNLGDKASIQKKSELSQSIRRDLEKARSEAAQARKLAKDEGKKNEYDMLLAHVKKTEALYNQRFRAADDTASSLVAGGPRKVTELDSEMTQLGQPMVNLREDEEFQMFFEQVQKNDQIIDQALDRISANVQVLHNQAVTISQELKVQNQLLDETQQKTEKIQNKLDTLNKRLKKTIKDVEKDRICIYIICFILLLGLGGAIYWQATKNKK